MIRTTKSASFTVFLRIDFFNDAFTRRFGLFFLHHAFADGGHLRTMIRIDDRRDDVAAECRTDLVKQVFILFAAFHVGVRADFEARAVGRQAAVQRRRYARAEVASDRRGAEQRDLRLLFLENPADDRRMRQRAVRGEAFAVGNVYPVGAVFGQFFFNSGEVVSQRQRFEFAPERVGQHAAFGQ